MTPSGQGDTVRVVRDPTDGMYRVEGTDRLFSGKIVRTEGRDAFIGREVNYCPECGGEVDEDGCRK